MTTLWKYCDATGRIVFRTLDNGAQESCLVTAIADWIAAGNTPLPADPKPVSQQELDEIAARSYPKLVALCAMSPAQVDVWIEANITNLAGAKDAIKTLAIAVSILSRRI